MTNQMKNVPELRFPEFDGEWEEGTIKSLVHGNLSDGDWINKEYLLPNGKYRIIQTGNISVGKYLNKEKSSKFISQSSYDELKANEVFPGDILISRLADPAGRSIIMPNINWKMVTSVDVAIIRPNKKFESYFLISILNTDKKLYDISKLVSGASHKRISRKNLEKVKIIYPKIQEQQKIGDFFSKLDRQIELEEQKLEKLEEQKKGYMQKIFSQELRFKDENGNEYPEWEEKTIKDVYKVTRGYVLARKLMSDNPNSINKYPVYSSQTSNNGLMGYYSDYLYQDAITWTTDGANAGSVSFRQGKFYCTNVCGVLLNELGNSNVCMAEMLNNIAFKYVSKVGNPKLMNNVMAMIKLKFPCLEEQQAISKFLNVFSEVIDNQNKKVELLKERKKGFLQKMFV